MWTYRFTTSECRTSINVLFGLILGDPITLLNFSFELIAPSGDFIQIVRRLDYPTSL